MNTTVYYRHNENQIDPRDKNLVTWDPKQRMFVVERSMLDNVMGPSGKIEPFYATYGNNPIPEEFIWMWSSKHQVCILYFLRSRVYNGSDIACSIYEPFPNAFYGLQDRAAYEDAVGTTLHILND